MKKFLKIFIVAVVSVSVLLCSFFCVSAYDGEQFELLGGIEFDKFYGGIAGSTEKNDVDYPSYMLGYSRNTNNQYFALRMYSSEGFLDNAIRYFSFDLILPDTNKTYNLELGCKNNNNDDSTMFNVTKCYVKSSGSVGTVDSVQTLPYQILKMRITDVKGGSKVSFKVYFQNTRELISYYEYIMIFYIAVFEDSGDLYTPPTVGGDIDNFSGSEDALLNNTESGRNTTSGLFNNLSYTIRSVSSSLLVIRGMFNYFIGGSILSNLLLISITFGMFAFLLNVGISAVGKSRSSKGDKGDKGGG